LIKNILFFNTFIDQLETRQDKTRRDETRRKACLDKEKKVEKDLNMRQETREKRREK